ncbi:WLM domain-containing protein [Botrytis cinerea]
MSTNTERDALISSYSHLKGMKREAEALHSLKKIASGKKNSPWEIGLNVNRGQKICLRLRYPGDQNQFLPIEEVVDTMLHELCHNEIGPHNQEFHALWDQLRKEHEGLVNKGYTGEGFLSEGKSLGGRRVPRHEARRLARIAAEKRQNSPKGSDQKLGGRPVPYGTDIRKVIVDAIERRNKVLKGCGESRMNPIEIKDLADEATHNGFKTLAEEDLANDAAIAQAMWELVREDQKKEYGDLYVPPSVQNPAGTSGGNIGGRASDENSIKSKSPPKLKDPQNEPAQGPGGHVLYVHFTTRSIFCAAMPALPRGQKASRSRLIEILRGKPQLDLFHPNRKCGLVDGAVPKWKINGGRALLAENERKLMNDETVQ